MRKREDFGALIARVKSGKHLSCSEVRRLKRAGLIQVGGSQTRITLTRDGERQAAANAGDAR